MMQIGRMRERVTIQAPRTGRNSLGEATVEWDAGTTVWAKVEGLRSREILQAMQANAIVSHRVTIRFYPSITHEHRMIWRGRKMEVVSVVEKMDRQFHELMVREVQ